MPMAVRDLVGEWFESATRCGRSSPRAAMLLTGLGPRMPGTAGVLLTDVAGNDGGLAGQTVFARGGPGALTTAGRRGAIVRRRSAYRRGGGAGPALRRVGRRRHAGSGENHRCSDGGLILDPKTTLLDLLDPEALGPRLSWRAGNIRQRGATAKVNFALRGLPRSRPLTRTRGVLRGRILLAPSMAASTRSRALAKYGEMADAPLIEATIPSLVDPGLVDESRQERSNTC